MSPETSSLIAATSKGSLHQLPLDVTKWSNSHNSNVTAHSAPVHKALTDPSSPQTLFTCSDDATVKVWDLRADLRNPIHILQNSRNLPFFSMDVRHGLVSAGSQLKGTDSELVLWDTRKLNTPLRSFIDSHNDDITDTKFHPTRKNLLLSGATDGYVNIYDLNIVEEDDAQLQCINFSSVHSAGFTSTNRVYVLTHMETFGMFDLSSQFDLDPETAQQQSSSTTGNIKEKRGDVDFGDIREKWDCEYVVDLYAPGYVACGSNSKGIVKIFEFDPTEETFKSGSNSGGREWILEGGHGEDIVRDVAIRENVIFTAGEDSCVRVWNGEGLRDTMRCFFQESEEEEEGHLEDVESSVAVGVENATEEKMEVEYDLSKKERSKEKKDKSRKKHKKDSNKKHRFKPY
jgi:WD repeat-containing protein 89